MPVAKFKSYDEAADALLLREPSAPIAARMRALFALSARLAPLRPRPGVTKYRSLEEAERDRGS